MCEAIMSKIRKTSLPNPETAEEKGLSMMAPPVISPIQTHERRFLYIQ